MVVTGGRKKHHPVEVHYFRHFVTAVKVRGRNKRYERKKKKEGCKGREGIKEKDELGASSDGRGGGDVKTMQSLRSPAKVTRDRKTSCVCVSANVCVCLFVCAYRPTAGRKRWSERMTDRPLPV